MRMTKLSAVFLVLACLVSSNVISGRHLLQATGAGFSSSSTKDVSKDQALSSYTPSPSSGRHLLDRVSVSSVAIGTPATDSGRHLLQNLASIGTSGSSASAGPPMSGRHLLADRDNEGDNGRRLLDDHDSDGDNGRRLLDDDGDTDHDTDHDSDGDSDGDKRRHLLANRDSDGDTDHDSDTASAVGTGPSSATQFSPGGSGSGNAARAANGPTSG